MKRNKLIREAKRKLRNSIKFEDLDSLIEDLIQYVTVRWYFFNEYELRELDGLMKELMDYVSSCGEFNLMSRKPGVLSLIFLYLKYPTEEIYNILYESLQISNELNSSEIIEYSSGRKKCEENFIKYLNILDEKLHQYFCKRFNSICKNPQMRKTIEDSSWDICKTGFMKSLYLDNNLNIKQIPEGVIFRSNLENQFKPVVDYLVGIMSLVVVISTHDISIKLFEERRDLNPFQLGFNGTLLVDKLIDDEVIKIVNKIPNRSIKDPKLKELIPKLIEIIGNKSSYNDAIKAVELKAWALLLTKVNFNDEELKSHLKKVLDLFTICNIPTFCGKTSLPWPWINKIKSYIEISDLSNGVGDVIHNIAREFSDRSIKESRLNEVVNIPTLKDLLQEEKFDITELKLLEIKKEIEKVGINLGVNLSKINYSINDQTIRCPNIPFHLKKIGKDDYVFIINELRELIDNSCNKIKLYREGNRLEFKNISEEMFNLIVTIDIMYPDLMRQVICELLNSINHHIDPYVISEFFSFRLIESITFNKEI